MKFARYLQDTQTPEWKRAYIDYHALKKLIADIRKTQEGLLSESPGSEPDDDSDSEASHHEPEPEPDSRIAREPSEHQVNIPTTPWEPTAGSSHAKFEYPPQRGDSFDTARRNSGVVGNARRLRSSMRSLGVHTNDDRDSRTRHEPSDTLEPPSPSKHAVFGEQSVRASPELVARDRNSRRMSSMRGHRSSLTYAISLMSFKRGHGSRRESRPTISIEFLPLKDLLPRLGPSGQAFFAALDAQLDKIESFYITREAEVVARSKILREQLEELGDHIKLVQATHSRISSSWSSTLINNVQDKLKWKQFQWNQKDDAQAEAESKEMEEDKRSTGRTVGLSPDTEDYLYAKKKLRKAVLEHYRGLEVLQNYRILNLTGFRKVLEKFEKTTNIKAQRQYMSEKVERSAFASDKNVQEIMRDMENLYAVRFTHGDKKCAVTRLRTGFQSKSHHYSVFRSGILLGSALPAFVSGLHASFQQSTRDEIPGWDGLLFIYGILSIPVLFSILVGANLLVWAHARINYVFIFELDTRTRMDHREYYEIPSILLAGLCYAFWLSFLRIGAPHISPTIWPLVWLGFCGLVMIDPLPLLYKPSRYWFLKNVGKLFISGARPVEFTDFWMGDQFCSLVFSLSNVYLFACVYALGFDNDWTMCGASSPQWPVEFLLASLPFLIRLVQSVKRYYESGLVMHLINGGKYGSGIVSNLFFYVWRHQDIRERGTVFALWLLFSTLYSIYASSWDFLVDWSVLDWRAKYPLLRPELVYTDSISLYYIAIVTNILIRFIWVIYIPIRGPNMFVRTFIGAVFEILRRWQWNFYRLESEHLGNMDQYRVTHEVPLPYSFDDRRC